MRVQNNVTAPIGRRRALKIMAGMAAGSVAFCEPHIVHAQGPTQPALDLSRGVNLSHWFAQSLEGYGEKHFATFVTRADLQRIASAGFSHVRLSFEPDIVFTSGAEPALQEDVVAQLLRAIDMIGAEKLSIVLDMHPVGASKNKYLAPEGADRLVANWTLLAKKLSGVDPIRLAFEILNEPNPLRGDAWWQLQERAVAAIRHEDGTRAIIVNGGGWSSIDDLVSHTPYSYDGLIYSFHHYHPMLFTHQSASWTWEVAGRIHGLPWPIAAEDADHISQTVTSRDSDREILRNQIVDGQFTPGSVSDSFDRLAAWAAEHGKPPIYVGEFGVYLKSAPRESRLRWLSAAQQAFQKNGWGWALWDDSRDFGFLAPSSDHEIDRSMLQALGMNHA